ncbi:WYL domain-containing protein [Mariniphaga sediminis]|uniref:WYL domain-containing protein n=1 Tax=Mariniphaga sediminis TaxID=1628158 RepID=A0A399D6Q9_9BACT|nr:WYL domain-containing protein [Mariniphaga sediminis]RIH67156.1 WYL domain-containing protein [Mariniphaga sediminis]
MPHDNKAFRLLRLLFFLSGSYPKTRKECTDFLDIRESAFYNYRNELINIGFNLQQKEGKYWVEAEDKATHVLANLLHFSEEEAYILAKSIDAIEGHTLPAKRLKQKLVAFLNQDKAVEAYLKKEKTEMVSVLNNAVKNKKQVLLVNYASGNSQTVKNRRVEPFEFKDDFNLVWAFDTEVKKNRQFKICRMEDALETPFGWKYEHLHHSAPVDVFRNTGELNKQVEFELNLRARNLLVEEYPLTEKYITGTTKNHFLFKVPVAKYEGPGRFMMGMAEDIRLIGDDGFIEFLKEKIDKCKHFL